MKLTNKILTKSLKFLFELDHMFTISDAKIIIRVRGLMNTIYWICCANSQDRGWPLSPLCPTNLLHRRHACRNYSSNARGGCARRRRW